MNTRKPGWLNFFGIWELDSSIAKDLIDSEDAKHTLFCREIASVAIYTLVRDNILILSENIK